MHGALALSLLVVMAEPSSGVEEVKALRAAYAVHPSPWILLGITEVQADHNRCTEAEATFREFFEVCDRCDALEGAQPVARRLIERCTPPPDAIGQAVRRRWRADPDGRAALKDLVRILSDVDMERAADLSWIVALRATPSRTASIRRWTMGRSLSGLRLTVDQAQRFLDPMLRLDEPTYRWLLGAIEQSKRKEGLITFPYTGFVSLADWTRFGWIQKALYGGCSTALGYHGFVSIQTSPPSEIWAFGRLIGETPFSKARLPSGCAIITAKEIGGHRETKKRIRVEPNDTKRYQFSLK